MLSYLTLSQTPMGQWLHLRARYLHLLLEREGVTKAPKCSICSNAMEVKCSECMGGNYFCKACCIQSQANTIPSDSPMDWCTLWPSILVLTGLCAAPWASW